MSKAAKQPRVDQFRGQIKNAIELLELAGSPAGFLTLLPQLLSKVEKCPPSAKIHRELVAILGKGDQELRACKQRMLDWMLLKVRILEKISLKNGWTSMKRVQEVKAFLQGERPELVLGGDFWTDVHSKFQQACSAVASFGDKSPFEGYAEIRIQKQKISFEEPLILDGAGKELFPTSSQGKLLAERLGHGFIKATIEKGCWGSNRIYYEIEHGVFNELRYPKDEYADLMSRMTERDWKIAEDSSLPQIFRQLSQLSCFSQMKPVPLQELSVPKGVIGCDELSNQQKLQYFLSAFGTDWAKAPYGHDVLLRLVKRFVILIEEAILEEALVRKPRQMKNEARQFVQNVLEKELLPLPLKERNRRKYDSLRPVVWKAAQQSGILGLVEACSETLIGEECTAFAKKHGWRPSRKKSKKKKGSAV